MFYASTLRQALALALAVPLAAVTLVAPAGAAPPDTYSSRTSGGQAFAQWTEYDVDDDLGLPGNVHVGYLSVYQQPGYTDVSGAVEDYDCKEGEVPGGGGHFEDEPGEDPNGLCDFLGVRFLSGYGSTTFSVDVKSGTAKLTGTLEVSSGGHGDPGETLAQPPVNMTWTAAGSTYSFRRTEAWSDGTTSYRSRVTGTGFDATISGAIGRMGFADDADDESGGNVETWREMSRTRIR